MRKFILSFIVIAIIHHLYSQGFNSQQFEDKIKMSKQLLLDQPTRNNIRQTLLPGFNLDSINTNHFYLKDPLGNQMTAYLHIESLKIVYIEFYEKESTSQEIIKYLTEVRKFEWWGSNRLCDYLNDKKISIVISPGMQIHVSKYSE